MPELRPDEGGRIKSLGYLTAGGPTSGFSLNQAVYMYTSSLFQSSVSSTSVTSQMRAWSPLQSPEAEMLREVYLVLWSIRKQLRQLARRQERCRRRHIWAHTCPQPDTVQGLKQDARSPL